MALSWLPILALAAASFAVAVLVLRLPRAVYSLLGATLLFGLTGYALQSGPGQPSAPGRMTRGEAADGALIVELRRGFYGAAILPSRFLITSDAFARRGDFAAAAGFARSALNDNPNDAEAWTALGNALIDHADGRLTPAARYAFTEGARRAPGDPAPRFFLGIAHLRSGEPEAARLLWQDVLARAPATAVWRPLVADNVARLDALLAVRPAPQPAQR